MTKKWRMTVRVLAALMGLAVAAGAAAQTNLGTVKAGSSASGGVNVTLSAAGTLGKINVLTQGVPQMDFTDAGGDGCAVGTVYAAGATCSVNVKFAPLYAGLRMGAVVLADASGNVLGTAYVTGTGLAGQLAFWPGAGMAYLSACGWDSGGLGIVGGGVAVDAAGNVYMTCPKTAQIFKEAPQLDGSWVVTQIVLNIGGPSGIYDPIPAGIAIDGAGNLYITDSNLNRVVMEVPAGSGYVEEDLSISGIAQPEGIAVDGSGNLYIADYFNQRVVEEVRTGSGYTSEVLATQLTRPVGIAVDAAGDVFVTAPVASAVYELTNCNGTCSVKLVDSFDLANGVTVDAVGNFYVLYEEGIAEEVPSSSGFTRIDLELFRFAYFTSGPAISGLAVDEAGNIFWASGDGASAYMAATPVAEAGGNETLGFGSGTYAQLGVVDVGNAPIDFSQVSFPIDFPVGPPLTTGSLPPANIPVAGVCATGMSLPESHACLLPISFLPVTSMNGQEFAALNEDVVLTSDARGSLANPVSVAVSGGVIAPSTNAVISVSADPITLGQPVSLNVNMPWTGAVAPTGTVSFDLMDMNTGAQTLMATVPVSNGQATDTLTGLQVGSTEYIAYYSGDSNYQAQSSWPIVVTVVNPPGVKDFGGNNFGTLNLGTVGSATPLTITFTTAETLGGVGVLTKGTPGLDFQDAGNGTCTIGRSYSAGDTCIVNVLFKPTEPGVRYGAVVLTDSGGNPIGTGFVQGTGIGPLAAFLPGYTTTLPFVPAYPNGISVDASGNIFVADGEVYELTPGNGTYTQTEVTRGLGDAYDVAVDGGGNLYVADLTSGGYRAVYKLTPSPGGYTQTALGYGFADVEGIAVDGAGNVFVAAADGRSNNTLFELTPSQGAYTQTSLVGPEASPNGGLSSVAVDGSGNLFVTDQNLFNANVFKGTPSASGYTWTTVASFLDGPVVRVAVDAAGNVYVANEDEVDSNGFVEEEAVQPDGTYVGTKIATAENMPMGVALDGRGNLYVSGNHGITKLDFSDPPALAFAATNEGMTSSDSPQALTLANSGNAAMTLTAVSYPADFPEASGATGDCRMGSLAVNARCTLTVDFRPQAAGAAGASVPLSESVTVSASQWSAPLAIAVGGTENIPASPTFGLGGTAVTLQPGATTGNTSTVTVVPGGGFTGSVTVTAALTSQPANAEYLPTFSFGSTSPVNITGTGAGTATLTISTTAPSSSAMGAHAPGPGGWTAAGGAVLVCVLLAWIPRRRCASRWLAGLVALALVLGSATACGGGGGNGGGGGGGGGGTIVGTTPGSYMITVTGTSGSMTQTCTVTLTVQ